MQKKRPAAKIQEEIRQNEQRLKNIQDDYADRLIDLDTFNHSRARYQAQIKKLQGELSSTKEETTEVQKLLKKGLHLLHQLPEFYQQSTVEVKRELLGSIFPEKLLISKTKSRPTKINEAVLLITATDKGFSGKQNGQLLKNVELAGQVENTGVELLSFSFFCFCNRERDPSVDRRFFSADARRLPIRYASSSALPLHLQPRMLRYEKEQVRHGYCHALSAWQRRSLAPLLSPPDPLQHRFYLAQRRLQHLPRS